MNTIRLISSDNITFEIDESIATLSKTIAVFIDPSLPFIQKITRTIKLPIESKYLKRIIEFMKYKNSKKGEFVVSDEEMIELLNIASYLRL